MVIEWADGEHVITELVDFVVPSVPEALALIKDGAINKIDLLEQAGLGSAEAEAELARIEAAE